jgi:hypothetical protein
MIVGQEGIGRTNSPTLFEGQQQGKFCHRHVWVYFSFIQCLIQTLQCFILRNRLANRRGP